MRWHNYNKFFKPKKGQICTVMWEEDKEHVGATCKFDGKSFICVESGEKAEHEEDSFRWMPAVYEETEEKKPLPGMYEICSQTLETRCRLKATGLPE